MISRRAWLGCAALGELWLLSGCQSLPANSRRRTGRFSLSLQTPSKKNNVTGRFVLTESREMTELQLLTPLSGILAKISIYPGYTEFEGYDGTSARGDSPEALMQKFLGFSMPISAIDSWLNDKTLQGDVLGDTRWDDEGWTVQVTARSATGQVKRLKLSRSLPIEITLTLVVDD